MPRPVPGGRSAFRLTTSLSFALLAGCTSGPPQACSLVLLESSVAVDVRGLDVDPATVDALLCVEDDCDALSGPADGGIVRRIGPDVPRADEVEVRLVLTDPGTGAEVYRGSGTVSVEVVEPNGAGCGETRTLPTVTAERDGTLRA